MTQGHLWLNQAARRLLIFHTLEAETLGFLYVQRSVCVYNAAEASDCYGWSVAFTSLGFGQYQELTMHSGMYMQDRAFQVYVPLQRVYCMVMRVCVRAQCWCKRECKNC